MISLKVSSTARHKIQFRFVHGGGDVGQAKQTVGQIILGDLF